MAKILRLDAHVADLIAAGEVVERPASVIKEILENAIDAGATIVTVEIKDGGMTYMRVTDNGGGIAPEDAETAFLRHATSKLRDERGLEAIATLGFRGEALAAIAAVSKIELFTRVSGADEGVSLSLEGGVLTDRHAAGCPAGTTLVVRDLFFNTPARLKFMKTDRAEGAAVSAQVIRCALSHPEVSVRYIKDGKEECHTPGDGRVDSCIYSLFGREFAAGLVAARSEDDHAAVTGYVCTPAAARGNRSYQFFFVNGRPVKSKTLQAALEQAYKNTLFTGRFPACVLYITMSPAHVDVNVHPAKTEVRFLYERRAFDAVYYAALAAVGGGAPGPEITLSEGTVGLVTGQNAGHTPEPGAETDFVFSESFRAGPAAGSGALRPPRRPAGRSGRPLSGVGGFMPSAPGPVKSALYAPLRDGMRIAYTTSDGDRSDSGPPSAQTALDGGLPPGETGHRIVGEALGTYVVVEAGEGLWLIDKHAAHERIHFDRLKAQGHEAMTQTLLEPILCRAGREDAALLLENAPALEGLGFTLEAFGEGVLAVRTVPSCIDPGEAESALGEIAQVLRRGGSPDGGLLSDALLHTVACKAAIKAGRRSEPMELKALANRVLSGEIRYCPHGRPVAIELTKAALDRSFKRT